MVIALTKLFKLIMIFVRKKPYLPYAMFFYILIGVCSFSVWMGWDLMKEVAVYAYYTMAISIIVNLASKN